MRALRALSAAHGRSPATWHALGTTAQELGEFETAIAAFETGARCDERALNLPCLTAAAAAAMYAGDVPRARRFLAEGAAVANAGGGFDGSHRDGFSGGGGGSANVDASHGDRARRERGRRVVGSGLDVGAAVNGEGGAYAVAPAAAGGRSRSAGPPPTARERATHLRAWALLEKRAGNTTAARALFARAANADASDATTWLQWGQFERRVAGAAAARSRFASGLRATVGDARRRAAAISVPSVGDDGSVGGRGGDRAGSVFARRARAPERGAAVAGVWVVRSIRRGRRGRRPGRRARCVRERRGGGRRRIRPCTKLGRTSRRRSGTR